MKIAILTIFPEMFESVLSSSILGRAIHEGLVTVEAVDIRPYSDRKHKNTDDYPFGGGAGMVMLAQPIVDAVRDLHLPFPISPIIKGDSTSYNVAAASIVAKVTRDREMVEMAKLHPEYGFERNMGYGTAEHMQALRTYGPTPFHRRSFIGKLIGEGRE